MQVRWYLLVLQSESYLLLVELLYQPVKLLNVFILPCVCAAQDPANACSMPLLVKDSHAKDSLASTV